MLGLNYFGKMLYIEYPIMKGWYVVEENKDDCAKTPADKLTEAQKAELQKELDEKLPKYFNINTSIKDLEKDKDPMNARIKEIMGVLDFASHEVGDFIATRSIEERSNLNQAKLLVKLRELGHVEAIEMIEAVNQEVFEKLVYDKVINPADFANCVETTKIVKLTVKKKRVPKAAKSKTKKGAIVNAVDEQDIY